MWVNPRRRLRPTSLFCHLHVQRQHLAATWVSVLLGVADGARTWPGLITCWCQTPGHVITFRNHSAVVNYEHHYLPSSRENGSFHFITLPNWVIVLPCNKEIVRKPFYTLWISMRITGIIMLVACAVHVRVASPRQSGDPLLISWAV